MEADHGNGAAAGDISLDKLLEGGGGVETMGSEGREEEIGEGRDNLMGPTL